MIKSLLFLKKRNGMIMKFKHLKKILQLVIKNLILLKKEPEITNIEIEENNFKIRFLYEISPQSYEKYMSYIPEFNQPRKLK